MSDTTKTVGRKYFDQQVQLTGGITLGLQNIRDAKKIVLAINGSHKSHIVERIFTGEITNSCPASLLRTLNHAYFVLDQASACRI